MSILPAGVYDALELSALAFGGIGGARYFEGDAPNCIIGHTRFLMGTAWDRTELTVRRSLSPLETGAGSTLRSDRAVRAINRRKGRDEMRRVTFAEWCAELKVVRGK